LADDVGVRLEDGNNFVTGGQVWPSKARRRVCFGNLVSGLAKVLELGAEVVKLRLLERLEWKVLFEFFDGEPRRSDRVLCDLHKIAVERQALFGFGSVLDRERTALCTTQVVGELERDVLAGLPEEPSQDAHAVDQ